MFIFLRNHKIMTSEAFALRLNEAFEESDIPSKAELSRLTGISQPYLAKMFKALSESLPPADIVLNLAQRLGVNYVWLVSGEGPKIKNTEPSKNNNFQEIPVYSVCEDKNKQVITEENTELPPIVWDAKFFRDLKIPHESCGCLIVDDDGMAPLIKTGDTILVHYTPEISIDNNKIYAFVYDKKVFVRKLIKNFSTLTFIPINPDFKEEELPLKEMNNVTVIGRVYARCGEI